MNNRFTITLTMGSKLQVSMGLDSSLAPEHQMTGLLYALDIIKERTGITDLQVNFDEENLTHEEEIITE